MFDSVPETTQIAIRRVLEKFIAGDASLFDDISPEINFRIEHYRDETDVSWQAATSLNALVEVISRLGVEVFPKGTAAIGIDSLALGNNWHLTRFEQQFFYAVRQNMCQSVTFILSHEEDAKLDFFREIVTTVDDVVKDLTQ